MRQDGVSSFMIWNAVTTMAFSSQRRPPPIQIHGAHIQAGVSTASMGKFDKKLVGEKEGERMPAGKRRKFMAVTDVQTERAQLTGLADKFLRER